MTPPGIRAPVTSSPLPRIPPLEPGDQLTREEFERRYEAMPQVKKAELLEGVVHMPSPVRLNYHAGPHADLITLFGMYRVFTPGVRVADNVTLRLDLENEPQPDAAVLVEPRHGGKVQLSADDYVEGGPELVAEVSSSTTSMDLNTKFRIYRHNRVQEYVVWRVLDEAIDWFVLRKTQYDRLPLNPAGIYQSEVFPGLWLDAVALAQLNLVRVHEVLKQGLASPEHAAFVAKLAKV